MLSQGCLWVSDLMAFGAASLGDRSFKKLYISLNEVY